MNRALVRSVAIGLLSGVLFRSARSSVGFWAVFLVGLRATVAPPEACGDASEESVRSAAVSAVGWMERSQQSDGSYLYDYDASSNTSTGDYNEVRHAGVTMALYQAAARLDDRRALATADAALVWMQKNLVRRRTWAALAPNHTSASLGATALMLVGLTERRAATGDPRYDDLMHELARFIQGLEAPDGSFARGYDLVADAPEEGASQYYPGESLWALALMHDAFPSEGWDTSAKRALDYIANERERVDKESFLPFNDQWAAYGIAELARWGALTDAHVAYAHRLGARFGLLARTEAQRGGSSYGRFLRGDDARGASAGTWLEGLTALWRASQYDRRLSDIEAPLVERATCMAGILVERQTSSASAKGFTEPSRVEGAWLSDLETRMDDQQHPFSGLLYMLDTLRGDRMREPSPPPVLGEP